MSSALLPNSRTHKLKEKIQDLRWRLAQGVAKNMSYLLSSPEQNLQSSDTEHASRIIPGFPHSNPSALPGLVDIWIYREFNFEFRFFPRWFFLCWHLQEEMWLSLQECFFQHHLWCAQYSKCIYPREKGQIPSWNCSDTVNVNRKTKSKEEEGGIFEPEISWDVRGTNTSCC